MFLKNYLATRFEPLLERLENKLEQEGKWQNAQKLRHKQFEWRSYCPELLKYTPTYISSVYDHCFQVQRESYLQAEHNTLFKQLEADPSLADVLVTEMQSVQKQLQDVNRDLWMAERDIESVLRDIPAGPFKRALCACRQTQYYSVAKFSQDLCVAKGGCCGRGCGCCTRPRNFKWPNHFAHCTSIYKCCEDVRGFKINSPNTRDDPMAISITINRAALRGGKRSFAKEVINAHIWGL